MLPNVAYFAICCYSALRAGAAVVPMNVLLKERVAQAFVQLVSPDDG